MHFCQRLNHFGRDFPYGCEIAEHLRLVQTETMPIGEFLHAAHGGVDGTELLAGHIVLHHREFVIVNQLFLKALEFFEAGIDGVLGVVGIHIAL